MEHHNHIFTLPSCLWADVLSIWLPLGARVKLDSACCNVALRRAYLEVACCPEGSVKPNNYVKRNKIDDAVAWATLRGVFVEHIRIGYNNKLPIFEDFFRKLGHGVTEVTMENALSDAISYIPLCQNLVKLKCHMCELSRSLRDIFTSCLKLAELDVSFTDNPWGKRNTITHEDFDGLCCPNLVRLSVDGCMDSEMMRKMMQLAVNAEVLRISWSELSPETISCLSPAITTFVYENMPLQVSTLAALVQRCPGIVNLDLSGVLVDVPMVREIGALRSLRSVTLAHRNMKEDVVEALAEECGDRLTALDVRRCWMLTADVLSPVLPRFKSLTTLGVDTDVNYVHLLDFSVLKCFSTLMVTYLEGNTAAFLRNIALHCTAVEHLHLQLENCDCRVSDVDQMVRDCEHLRTFVLCDVGYSPLYSHADIERCAKIRPNMVVSIKFEPL